MNIKCITTYALSNSKIQHVVLFQDGSEYIEIETLNFLLRHLFDRESLIDYYHIEFCGKWDTNY